MTELMIDGTTTVVQRPDAPYTLTDAEADEWRAIVNSMPAEHFARIHYPMLTQLCRHKVQSDRVAQLIEALCKKKAVDTDEYRTLLSMASIESSAIVRLCRSMRLTHQSLYRAESAKPRPVAMIKNPWDPDED
jgi:chaperone required for assembly of F1-ATPase